MNIVCVWQAVVAAPKKVDQQVNTLTDSMN